MRKLWNKLKTKWDIETDRRMIIIFIVFAITGSATIFVRKALYGLLKMDIETQWIAVVVKILFIYVIYQFLLLIIGFIFGEGSFFSWFIKKMNLRLIGRKPKIK
ncbi:MAG: hypothetical protein ACI8ZN_001751 [Bacteroidia bacterium]|jgi:hypothetical protein